MKVALFGATGGVGRQVMDRALEEGHDVRALVRDPARLRVEHERLQVVCGDVRDRDAVKDVVAGQEAALVTLGVRERSDRESLVSDGVANIVTAMERAGSRRLVFLSIMGVGPSRDNLGVARLFLPRILRDALSHRAIAEDAIRASDLEWVVARAVRLVDKEPTGSYRAGEDVRVGLLTSITRADVADFMVRQLTDDVYVGRAASLAA